MLCQETALEGVEKGHRLNALTPAYTLSQEGEGAIYRIRLINGI